MTTPQETTDASPPTTVLWLGALGILPFLGLGRVAWFAPESLASAAVEAVVAYGAVIVSFVGGAHWGFASHHLTGKQAPLAE